MAKPKRPRDPNQLAKLIVELSTGDAQEQDQDAGKDPKAVRRGQLGSMKGGKARAKSLTAGDPLQDCQKGRSSALEASLGCSFALGKFHLLQVQSEVEDHLNGLRRIPVFVVVVNVVLELLALMNDMMPPLL